MEFAQVNLPLVSFRYNHRFLADDTVVVSDSSLRFPDRDEIEASLAVAGFRTVDVREAPDRPGYSLQPSAEVEEPC